jgi:hypothetical protein
MLVFILPSRMPTYIVPGQRSSDGEVILDLWFLLAVGAIDLDERYKILNVDLMEDDVVILRNVIRHVHTRVSSQLGFNP